MAYHSEDDWFKTFKEKFSFLQFIDNERNKRLRPEILKRFLGLTMTDEERALSYGLPEGCRMREGAKIICSEKLTIGKYCWIGENAILDASGGLEVGEHTTIASSVFVWTHSSHLANLSLDNSIASKYNKRASTKIGSGTFIAGPSVVLPGIVIGDKVVIRPFSVVDKNIPDRSLYDRTTIVEGIFTEEKIQRMIQDASGL